MGAIADAFRNAWRNFNTDGVASSGLYKPMKAPIREIGGIIEGQVAALSDRIDTVEEISTVGAQWKQSVRVATTAAGVLASGFENGDTVDGVVLATGDRILLKNQSTASANGIYVVAATGAPTRATDADSGAEIERMAVFVREGTVNGATQWICTNTGTITVGTTALTFALINENPSLAEVIADVDAILEQTPVAVEVANVYVEGFGVPQAVTMDNAGRADSLVDTAGREWGFSDTQMVLKGRPNYSFDLVIYGGTLSAVMAAKRAKLRGLRVAIINPYARLGGVIVGGGLVATDFPSPVARNNLMRGLTRQFFQTIHAYYNDPVTARTYVGGDTQMLQFFDPRPFQGAIDLWSQEVDLIVNASPIFSSDDVRKRSDGGVSAIRSAVGWLDAKVVVDASNEGDLIRASGAPFRLGRESTGATGEPAAGFKPAGFGAASKAGFTTPPDGKIVELNSSVSGLSQGSADGRVQTLSIRSLLQLVSAGGIPFTAPPGYNKANYLAAGEGIKLAQADIPGQFLALQKTSSAGPAAVLAYQGTVRLRDGSLAYQTNNGTAAIVSNEIGDAGTRYANGNWATRRGIVEAQARWQQGYYYYIASGDIAVDWPSADMNTLVANAQTWGMAPNLYTYGPWSQHWPEWVYVREALRLEASYVMTQADLYASDSAVAPVGYDRGPRINTKPTLVVARWSYFLDAHACRIYEGSTPGTFIFEGGVANSLDHEVDPYDIPFGSLRTAVVPNLLVSVNIGVTHVAWMPTRMEPCFAMLGEACGEAAALMVENGITNANSVNVPTLQARLNQYGSAL